MNKFENPIQFKTKRKIGKFEINYSDLMEISQGGPEIGNISINGQTVVGLYGGPILYKKPHIYIPALKKKFLGVGFKLARINLNSLEVKYISNLKELIYLDKIKENQIYFYEDIDKTIYKTLKL